MSDKDESTTIEKIATTTFYCMYKRREWTEFLYNKIENNDLFENHYNHKYLKHL